MRVRRELEIASDAPAELFDDSQIAAESAVLDNENVSGHYRNSNGLDGYPDVWGKRAKCDAIGG